MDNDLNFLVTRKNGRVVAAFLQRWQAEKFIEDNRCHGYVLKIVQYT